MNAIRTLSSVLVIALAAAADLAAQQDTLVVPGARVRVTAPTVAENHLVGTVAAVDADTLVLGVNHGTSSCFGQGVTIMKLSIPFASMTSLEVSRGKKSNVGKGLGIGFLAGAALGAAIGFAAGDDPPGFLAFSSEQKAAAGAILGSLAGGVIGGVVGATGPSERWETVPLDQIRVSLEPRGGGLEVTAKFVF